MSDVQEPKGDARGAQRKGLRIRNGERPLRNDAPGSPIWHVPSESGNGEYTVNLDHCTCECLAFRKGKGAACKHIHAARIQRGIVTGKNVSLPNPYKNPPNYDAVKRNEEASVRELLRCLAERIPKRESAA